jgi:hypothetical protein
MTEIIALHARHGIAGAEWALAVFSMPLRPRCALRRYAPELVADCAMGREFALKKRALLWIGSLVRRTTARGSDME